MNPDSNPSPELQCPTVWQLKPWWCQPWSILLTGCGMIVGSWLLFHRVWFTSVVGLPAILWMVYFVMIYPRLFAEFYRATSPQMAQKEQAIEV